MRVSLLRWVAPAVTTLLLALAPAAGAATPDAGQVRFTKAAESGFDQYLLHPSPAGRSWISSHYSRMRAYSSFFDSRTSWYTNAWAYQNAYAIYRGQEAGEEQWILKDGQGRRLYIPFACSGGTCPQYAADIGDPGWRRHWIDDAKRLLAKGYRGIFVDDVNLAFNVSAGDGVLTAPIDPRTEATMTHDNWQRYFAEFMAQVRAELPAGAEIVQNQVYFHVGLTSPYVRRAINAATHLEFERGFNDTGIRGGSGKWGYDTVAAWIDYAHSNGKGVIYDVQADWGREYALANYFLYANGSDSIGMDAGGLPDDWWRGWETDLGAPLGSRYEWHGVKRRDFERGSVLVNPPDAPTRTLEVGGDSYGLDGAPAGRVKLDARDGAVLLRRTALPPALPTPSPSPTVSEPAVQTPGASAPLAGGSPVLGDPPNSSALLARCSTPGCRGAGVKLALTVARSGRHARRRTATLRGSARSHAARPARVSLRRKTDRRWITVRRKTRTLDRSGHLRVVFEGLAPGAYRAVVRFRAGPASAARTLRVSARR
jgi:hypothetical protein